MTDIFHRNCSEPICPHCGYAQPDAWEWRDSNGGGKNQCANEDCRKWFTYETETTRTFTTEKCCSPNEHVYVEHHRQKLEGYNDYVTYRCTACGFRTYKSESPSTIGVQP